MPARFQPLAPDLFLWIDVANCYVWRDGDAAILFDLGDGSVLEHLPELGIKQLDWVLFTHHHREQCQGAPLLAEWRQRGTRVACGARERPLFERPTSWRKMRPTLNDTFSVFGASYVRPPVEPIAIDHDFRNLDAFEWRGRRLICTETPGNSPGSMSYLFPLAAGWCAVSGDVMLDGSALHTWFDSEWDYGFGAGIYALASSASYLAGYDPTLLLPGQGPVVRNGQQQLLAFVEKLKRLEAHYLRGYSSQRFANCDQDTRSRPTKVPHVWQVTPHLYKFRGPNYWVNFAILIANNGRGLIVDCGLFDRAFLDASLAAMQAELGLKQIDALFVTHMHGDHALEADHLRRKYGAKLWTLAGVDDKFTRPWDFDLAALLPSYNEQNRPEILEPLPFDKVMQSGEVIDWEGYHLQADWMPGQTKYHACLHAMIDGERIAFCGDNIFASPTDREQGGNECVLARNGGTLEEGYLYGASYLHSLQPDVIIGGHCWVIDQPRDLIERYRERMLALRAAYQDLTREPDYRVTFDPYWVQVLPFRCALEQGERRTLTLQVKNHWPDDHRFRVAPHAPPGIVVTPPLIDLTIAAGQSRRVELTVAVEAGAAAGVQMIALDVTVDDRRLGEWFDFIVHVGPWPKPIARPPAPAAKPAY